MPQKKQPIKGLRITQPDKKQLEKVEHLLETEQMSITRNLSPRAEQILNQTCEWWSPEKTEVLSETQTAP